MYNYYMNSINFRYGATLLKAGSTTDGRIPITIIPNIPTKDRVNDLIVPEAFSEAREDFLKEGVIDYDHQSVLAKSAQEKAVAIIGQPEDLRIENNIPICDAYLFKSNPYVRDAIEPALETGSTIWGASVGGKTLKSEPHGGRFVKKSKGEKITKILLKHIAVTPLQKAVHPGSSVSLRKSFEDGIDDEVYFNDFEELIKSFNDDDYLQKALTAGAQTDIASLTGGQSIQGQSLEGTARKEYLTKAMKELTAEIIALNIRPKQYKEFLGDYNLTEPETRIIIGAIANNKGKVASLIKKIN